MFRRRQMRSGMSSQGNCRTQIGWAFGERIVKGQVRDAGFTLRALGDVLMRCDQSAILNRLVGNVDDPAVDQLRGETVGGTRFNRRLQLRTILPEVPVSCSCRFAGFEHLFTGAAHEYPFG